MICPKCGKEMCEGLIRSRICYVPFIFNRKSNIPIDTKIKFNPLVAFGPFIPLSKFSLSSPDSIAYYCDKCDKGVRLGINVAEDGTKTRFCKKCNEVK